jgi:hypothetical protein
LEQDSSNSVKLFAGKTFDPDPNFIKSECTRMADAIYKDCEDLKVGVFNASN